MFSPLRSSNYNNLTTGNDPGSPNLNLNYNKDEESQKFIRTDLFKTLYGQESHDKALQENRIDSVSDSLGPHPHNERNSSVLEIIASRDSSPTHPKVTKGYEPEDKMIKALVAAQIYKSYEGKDNKAFEGLRKIEERLEAEFPNLTDFDKFDICITRAAVYCLGQMNDLADQMLKEAEKYSISLHPRNHCELFARMWNMRGDIESRNNHLDNVLPPLIKAKSLFGSFGTGKDEALKDAMAWNQSNRGHHALKMKNFKEAEFYYTEALKLRKELKNDRLIAITLCDFLNLFTEWNDLTLAEACATSCLDYINKFNKDFYLKGKVFCLQAKISCKKKDYVKASKLHKEGLEILKKSLPPGNSLSKEYEKYNIEDALLNGNILSG